jgi:hypothetical protein
MHRELLAVADHTGGRVEMDVGDALHDAAKDSAGYYELRFRPEPAKLDGGYHHITISVRQPHLRVISSSYYHAPQALASAQLAVPAILTKALSSRPALRGITVKPRAWYFPGRSDALARVPLAAEIQLDPRQAHTSQATDSVHVVAALLYEGQHRILGTSSERLHWGPLTSETTQNDGLLSTTWHEDLLLPPGSYDLRVAALDDASGVVGSASWRFLIHAAAPDGDLAVSSLVLATHCLSSRELASARRDLLNPLTWQGCTLPPVSVPSFGQTDTVHLLMKLYPGRNMKHFPDGWTTTLSVSGAENTTGLSLPLKIESGVGAGWTIYSELPLKNLGISPGDHELTVTVSGPGKRIFSQKEHFSVREAK